MQNWRIMLVIFIGLAAIVVLWFFGRLLARFILYDTRFGVDHLRHKLKVGDAVRAITRCDTGKKRLLSSVQKPKEDRSILFWSDRGVVLWTQHWS
jgi:hypothetical protein